MITCKQCGCEFLSIWREGYPGGAETGITVLIWGIGQLLLGLVLFGLGFLFSGFYIFAVLMLLMGLLRIATIPDNRKTILQHGGKRCPNCDTENELHWYD
jgi:hypothetical protein